MSTGMKQNRRKTFLVNLAWVTALAVLLAVVYVLSYAPMYRWKYGQSFKIVDAPFTGGSTTLPTEPSMLPIPIIRMRSPREWVPISCYRPVHLLIDHTPLREPLFSWAGLFGVKQDFEAEYSQRKPNGN